MVSLKNIQEARARIGDRVFYSPCARSEMLSALTGRNTYVKLENLQMTGSFKERGALNKMMLLSGDEKDRGAVTASAGNHAQGVARAGQLLGIGTRIVMPETTPYAKIQGTKYFGAEVILHGSCYDEAYTLAKELCTRSGATFIHAFDDPHVIAGQGTVGLELAEQLPDFDAVVIPVGGGGLIAGIAVALKALRPGVRVIGVETALVPSMKHCLDEKRIVPGHSAPTLAEGIAVAVPGELTYPIVRELVEEIVTVSDDEIATAILLLLEKEKTVAEGAGAAAFAALMSGKIRGVSGKNVCIIVSGGNIDMTVLSKIVQRGLEADGRLARIMTVVPDRPGSVAKIAGIIATAGGNIFDLSQDRPASDVTIGQAELTLLVETHGNDHVAIILRDLEKEGIVAWRL